MRQTELLRSTLETNIDIRLNLDGTGKHHFNTSMPFFEHMLNQISKHAQLDLSLTCNGDNQIDDHHSVEDIGLAFGSCLKNALGDKTGITRYGYAYAPLDESLSRVVIDLSGRPHLTFNADFNLQKVKDFDVELVREFFQAVANTSLMSLHIDSLRGINTHHQIESIFKAFGLALKQAITITNSAHDIPSTKGML